MAPNAPYVTSDAEIRQILTQHSVVAVVGISVKTNRPSYQVSSYLQSRGYTVVPVNPGCKEVLGETCCPSLLEIPFPVDIVDIFRRADAVPSIAGDAVKIGAKVVWMQKGIVHNKVAEMLIKKGIQVVMDRCMMIEYAALQM